MRSGYGTACSSNSIHHNRVSRCDYKCVHVEQKLSFSTLLMLMSDAET